MSLVIAPNKQQALSVKDQLLMLSLPANKRVRILKTLGRSQRAKARKRIREQRTVTGQSFAPRKNGKKTKLLKRLGRTLEPYVKSANRLELKHKSTHTGRIAALQQEGGSEQMSKQRMARIHGQADYDAPCTRAQAKALSKEGYKVKRQKGKGYRKASLGEITASLSQGQAGLILRQLRGETSKQSWPIPVPSRSFLGDTPENVQAELATLLSQTRG
ncbi:phage virion morphogenesis protein [Shewanella sp. MBTL60-007]|uniref:phage virion morphogenesis protein n=1 Tax=Shewanella sp. MBTL60-007 TaxID=2815911 RepID=UPI001BBA5448|nr:phage virion morphogenesis protein [Shewanella sp. MBTL60-007]GIU12947.1 hypothetical protein TUM3792_02030 [Shewanella sp. MBTL60-007]